MADAAPTPPDLLCREVLSEASRQRGTALEQARTQARGIRQEAEAEVAEVRRKAEAAVQAEVERRRAAVLANVVVETRRRKAMRLEAWLESIREAAIHELRDGSVTPIRDVLPGLAAEAMRQMAGESFRLRLSPQNRSAWEDGMEGEIRFRLKRPDLRVELVADAGLKDTEVILEDSEGRQMWQVDPLARLERLWPQLRAWLSSQLGGATPGEQRNHEP